MSTLKCRECGYVLKQWPFTTQRIVNHGKHVTIMTMIHLQPGIRKCGANMINANPNWYMEEVYSQYNGRCPRCYRKLPTPKEYSRRLKVDVHAS